MLTLESIGQVGFPIAVTCYLLYERSAFNQKVSDCLLKVTETVERIEQQLRR